MAGALNDLEAGQNPCKNCLENTFAANLGTRKVLGIDGCKSCDPGKRSLAGSSVCSDCGAGKSGAGVSEGCGNCATGQYRGSTDTEIETCKKCASGYYANLVGQGSCLPCIRKFIHLCFLFQLPTRFFLFSNLFLFSNSWQLSRSGRQHNMQTVC